MSRVSFYVWQGDDIKAGVSANHKTPNGGNSYGHVGQVDIKQGDLVAVTYGASQGVYTRSGRGYEMQYPHGLMTRFADGASVELNGKTAIGLKYQEDEKTQFDNIVVQQKEKYAHLLAPLVTLKEQNLIKAQQESLALHCRNQETRKAIMENALDKMEAALGKRKP